jgi:hypothetical protein
MDRVKILLFTVGTLLLGWAVSIAHAGTYYDPPSYSSTTGKATMGLVGGPFYIYAGTGSAKIPVIILSSTGGITAVYGISASTADITGTLTASSATINQSIHLFHSTIQANTGSFSEIFVSTINSANVSGILTAPSVLISTINSPDQQNTVLWLGPFTNGYRVSIGTTDVSYSLNVYSSIRSIYGNLYAQRMALGHLTPNAAADIVEPNVLLYSLLVGTGTNNDQRHLAVHRNGNVGIGTTLPSAKLEIKDGSVLVSGTNSTVTATTAQFQEIFFSTGHKLTRLEFQDGTVQTSASGVGGDNLGNHNATQNLNMNNFNVTNVSTVTYSDGSSQTSAIWIEDQFTAGSGQNVFTLTQTANSIPGIFAFGNGLFRSQGDDYTVASDSKTITFTFGWTAGDSIRFKYQKQ